MDLISPKDYSRTIVTVMKDEAPYMIDWIAYHLAIGFTHFVILTNDCSDGTEKIARKLERVGIVTHKNNPAPHPRGPQKTGYQRMRKLEAVEKADWLMALDVDEYLRIDQGDGTLDGLFQFADHKPNAYSFVWQLFGNNNVENISKAPVYSEFTHSQIPLQCRPYEATSIKTLYQNGFFEKIGTHRPNDLIQERSGDFLWIDADGNPMIHYYLQRHWRAYENGLGYGTFLGRINHYALRSLESYFVKWQRGFVHPNAPTVRGKGTIEDYWKLFNWNDYMEIRSLPLQAASASIKSALLSIENIQSIYDKSFEWHQTRAHTLISDNQEIYERLKNSQSTKIDDVLPDFSHHGSPKTLDQPYIPKQLLQHKARQTSIFSHDMINKHYEVLT